jgi:hypothetical protein
MPRPKLNPTDEQRAKVKTYAATGTPQKDIARLIGIKSPKTLRKYFREELDFAAPEANAAVAGFLFKKAKEGNVEAQKFWLLHRAGWGKPSSNYPAVAPPPFVVACEEEEDNEEDKDKDKEKDSYKDEDEDDKAA